jgi:hypothetical protein
MVGFAKPAFQERQEEKKSVPKIYIYCLHDNRYFDIDLRRDRFDTNIVFVWK